MKQLLQVLQVIFHKKLQMHLVLYFILKNIKTLQCCLFFMLLKSHLINMNSRDKPCVFISFFMSVIFFFQFCRSQKGFCCSCPHSHPPPNTYTHTFFFLCSVMSPLFGFMFSWFNGKTAITPKFPKGPISFFLACVPVRSIPRGSHQESDQ